MEASETEGISEPCSAKTAKTVLKNMDKKPPPDFLCKRKEIPMPM